MLLLFVAVVVAVAAVAAVVAAVVAAAVVAGVAAVHDVAGVLLILITSRCYNFSIGAASAVIYSSW